MPRPPNKRNLEATRKQAIALFSDKKEGAPLPPLSSNPNSSQNSKGPKWDELMGSGSYGFVHKIIDPETNEASAIKVNFVEKSMDFIGSFREIDMLKRLKHPFIIELKDIVYELPVKIPNKKHFKPEDHKMRQDQVYMIFEAGDFDLDGESLSSIEEVDQCIVHCLLALEYMHLHHHIHRDIKPGNLVYFTKTKTCKLIDFGFTKPIYPNCESHPKAVTAAYRAPELFNNNHRKYSYEADIWALAMSWLWMFIKKEADIDDNTSKQTALEEIFSLIPVEHLSNHEFRKHYPYVKHRPTWEDLLEDFYSVKGLKEVLSMMLHIDPSKRATCTQLLNHYYFDPYREVIDETRKKTLNNVPEILKPYIIKGELSPERIIMLKECVESEFIDKRCIFHAIDIIDRYIEWRRVNNHPRPQNPDIIIQRARVILYLMYKYFNIMTTSASFSEVWPKMRLTDALKKELGEWEKTLVRDILKYEIYRMTPFEMAKDDKALLNKYLEKYKDPEKINGVLVEL